MSPQTIELEWILPESEKNELVPAIELAGGIVDDSGLPYRPGPDEASDYSAAGFEPMTMIAISATVVYVIQSLVKTWRDRNVRGSTIVDTRNGRLRVRRLPSGANGQLVVLQDQEKVQVFKRDQENDGTALLKELLPKIGKKSAE